MEGRAKCGEEGPPNPQCLKCVDANVRLFCQFNVEKSIKLNAVRRQTLHVVVVVVFAAAA